MIVFFDISKFVVFTYKSFKLSGCVYIYNMFNNS